jgi:AcrR family transcriptional regulator
MSISNLPASGGHRQQLCRRAVDVLAERGISDVSLRELASALGTSHRMLIYHFGSKEGLLTEVVRETERRQRAALADLSEGSEGTGADVARTFWHRLRSAELAPLERLFFEVYGQALQGRSYATPLLENVVDSWVEVALPALKAQGLSEADARAEARLGVAVARGLLLDVLATGDVAGVDAAFERFVSRSGLADPSGAGVGGSRPPGR